MNDALLVRGVERVGKSRGDPEELLGWQGALGDEDIERLALDELHGQEVDAARLLDRVDADDAGMIQGGECFRLALEPLEPLGASGHLGRQDFQGHVAAELCVFRAVDFAHSAGADRRDDLVRPEPGARWECHGFFGHRSFGMSR